RACGIAAARRGPALRPRRAPRTDGRRTADRDRRRGARRDGGRGDEPDAARAGRGTRLVVLVVALRAREPPALEYPLRRLQRGRLVLRPRAAVRVRTRGHIAPP